ncbi:MAG: 5-amino-6-(D-ribitylamino)uracil--L-tyrosine 4-hydroxyphenyl transferase CofH [Calditrichaeota bacterium]|jgi:7,8-didemethyl-8-hydroxy-5-deazariboflavin synthase CofH subunit|nr:5-amino-6-(D-ribitylamino)uracil--L-tyrosine 4-hydroxyphenyl transferase CofH [Deltaproteobacteria bacterium]MBT7616917.1 5-amino-6-(D-ribitylamino)uracil--L-tyrosine 4-hydroxyphenyl transferase CofH [Calditrichota bacterium]
MKMNIDTILSDAANGKEISTADLLFLLKSRDGFKQIIQTADMLNQSTNGDFVSFVHNRNINYTNICQNHCKFCGFRHGSGDKEAFLLSVDEILAEIAETPEISEVCIQGGIYEGFGIEEATRVLHAIKGAYPGIHIHAFSPMEIKHYSLAAGRSVETVLHALIAAGLDSLPGTAAEILDDNIRRTICPDKLTTKEWIEIITLAHSLDLKTTSTIMLGHIEQPEHVAAHLEILRHIQKSTRGFTEFIPLFFVPQKTALAKKFNINEMLTIKHVMKLFALSRIYFNGYIDNIQSSWPKLGLKGAVDCLAAGVNDLGGTLYSENITRCAGGSHGQSVSLNDFKSSILGKGKIPRQRDTLYNLALPDKNN